MTPDSAGGTRALPAPVEAARHLAPDGWNGVGLAQLSALLGGQVTLVLEQLDDALPPEMGITFSTDEVQAVFEELLPLLLEHDLDHLVTMTATATATGGCGWCGSGSRARRTTLSTGPARSASTARAGRSPTARPAAQSESQPGTGAVSPLHPCGCR